GFIRRAEYEPECWRESSEFCRGHEGKIDLQSAREEKYAVDPGTGCDIQMMHGKVPIVHVRRPVGEDVRQFGHIGYRKGEIDIRPLVLAFLRRRACDRTTAYARVTSGVCEQVGAQAATLFGGKHQCHASARSAVSMRS